MNHASYCFRILAPVPLADLEAMLVVAMSAAEGIHGRAQVRLDARFGLDREHRTCHMDASTEVGRTLAHVFTELLTRGFGEEAFQVERVEQTNSNQVRHFAGAAGR